MVLPPLEALFLDAYAQQNICPMWHKVWVLMATIRRGLGAAMFSAQTAREQQECRSQAITPRL